MRRLIILLQIGIREIGLQFFRLLLFPFLSTGTTLAFSHSRGNSPSFRQSLKIIERGLQIELPHIFIIRILSISRPCVLFGSMWLIILAMSLLKKCIESRHFFVSGGRSVGKTLLLLKREHSFRKKWFDSETGLHYSLWQSFSHKKFVIFKCLLYLSTISDKILWVF